MQRLSLQERKAGTIDVNLQGVALGDAWISPVDTVLSWADYLLQTVSKPTLSAMTLPWQCSEN